MKQIRRFLLFFVILSFRVLFGRGQFCLFAQPLSYFTPENLRAEVEFLSSDELGGRGFGTGPNQLASFYLYSQMRNAGLRTSVQSFKEGDKIGHNIVGVTKGWYKRYIVVGAYYDALGRISDVVYPGADSNASGVAALLTLLRSLPAVCNGEVGVIFVAFDGHNANLSGSREFLSKYKAEYPMAFMVNLDIIGTNLVPPSSSRSDYLIALGGLEYSFSIDRFARSEGISMSYDYYGSDSVTELFYRRISDQKWFLQSRIESIMFTSGITEHTNKKTDTPSTINFSLLARRTVVIFNWLAQLVRA